VEWYGQQYTDGLWETLFSMTLYTPEISYRVHRAWTRAGVSRGRRLTSFLYLMYKKSILCITISTHSLHYEQQPVSVGSFSEPYETHKCTLRGKCTQFYVKAYGVCTCNDREGLTRKPSIFFSAQLSVSFVRFSDYVGIIPVCCINVTETQFVVYDVETELATFPF
jgi:hypothetical protein